MQPAASKGQPQQQGGKDGQRTGGASPFCLCQSSRSSAPIQAAQHSCMHRQGPCQANWVAQVSVCRLFKLWHACIAPAERPYGRPQRDWQCSQLCGVLPVALPGICGLLHCAWQPGSPAALREPLGPVCNKQPVPRCACLVLTNQTQQDFLVAQCHRYVQAGPLRQITHC